MRERILILCTGNSARSQMAEGFLRSFATSAKIESAGTDPTRQVNPFAVKVMNEVGIDISDNHPKDVDQFLNDPFEYVITVCDHARETCPVFTGRVKQRIHFGFEDPAAASGSEEEILAAFRRVRDEIKSRFHDFYLHSLAKSE